jgi:nitroimidazol reductase NimA-like FMN-containing flavoprotein (pyridoxamine 5'-phosphate oxidase superfamily)
MEHRIDPRTRLEILERDECMRLLEHSTIGRIAVVVDGRPFIFPVNFAVEGATVVLRTDPGTKLHGARSGPVAFECDGTETMYHGGWSVLITGVAEEAHDADLLHLRHVRLGPWGPGPKSTWLRIRPETISGRRLPPPGSMATQGTG